VNPTLEEIQADIAAFADDDEEVVIDRSGQAVFMRGGEEVSFSIGRGESDALTVIIDGETVNYRRFLTHHLARLDVLASRILEKRQPVQAYVDGGAMLESASEGRREDTGLKLLDRACRESPPFASRVVFITADAGHGKTALLREYQTEHAQLFLDGRSDFVFWHVDLQGRQLLRLSEALMGDLGELRVAGLWMPAIVRLLRHRAVVLAIDGFDELAAEQGSTDALGALSLLVQQMQNSGTIVAASRRTFFDTDDYVRRAGLFRRGATADCEFDQLSLSDWTAQEATEYLTRVDWSGRKFRDPPAVYEEMRSELGDENHPMLTRPFLITHIAWALLMYKTTPAEFIRGMTDPLRGVGAVVEAFVNREVQEKWRQAETGEPYLTEEQHFRLLADVAEEMFRAQRDRLEVDVIETLTTLLLDEWHTEALRRQQVIEMVKMHVLLTPPDGDFRTRSFDHPEFRDWFIAYALKDQLLRAGQTTDATSLSDLLSVAQMSDATASYACALLPRSPGLVAAIISTLTAHVAREWRPTYLQSNVGTLIPFLLDGIAFEQRLVVEAAAIYSSLIFEGKRLDNVTFVNGTFVNVSFAQLELVDVNFIRCEFGELTLDVTARYMNVTFMDCKIDGVRVLDESGEEVREYAPHRIVHALEALGITSAAETDAAEIDLPVEPESEGETRRLVQRLLGMFRRTTILPESTLQQRFPRNTTQVRNEVIPLLERHGVIQVKTWRGAGRQSAWSLTRSLDEILRADGDPAHPLAPFWAEVDGLP
jgi:hypothetical protein